MKFAGHLYQPLDGSAKALKPFSLACDDQKSNQQLHCNCSVSWMQAQHNQDTCMAHPVDTFVTDLDGRKVVQSCSTSSEDTSPRAMP